MMGWSDGLILGQNFVTFNLTIGFIINNRAMLIFNPGD
jgi:hypothetical protein